MEFILGSDHIGIDLKIELAKFINDKKWRFKDCGTLNTDRCDYNKIANKVTGEILANDGSMGLLICGTGVGMSIAANRKKGIRAVCCSEVYSAMMSRKHNDSNILCLGSRILSKEYAIEIFKAWIKADFESGRHQKRVMALDEDVI